MVKCGKVVSKVCEIYWMGICFDCNCFEVRIVNWEDIKII